MSTTNILALDRGGTKCDVLLVDCATGKVIRRVRHASSELPEEVRMSVPKGFLGGIGRSEEMLNYCLDEVFEGHFPDSLHLWCNSGMDVGNYFIKHGIPLATCKFFAEASSALKAEDLNWGICLVAGTGTCGTLREPNGQEHLLDAKGQDAGDWGGGTSIGRAFFRCAAREQNFSHEVLPDTLAIVKHFQALSEYTDKTPTDDPASLWPAVGFLMHHPDRFYLASLTKVCSACAINGSAVARKVMENGGRDFAETIRRAAIFWNLADNPELHVVAAGSIPVRSDYYFNAVKEYLQEHLPKAKLIRGIHPQVRGLVFHAFSELPDSQAQLDTFRQEDVTD